MIRVMSRVIELLGAKTPAAAPATAPVVAKSADGAPSAELLAAIQSAIHQHRARRG
jgi:oxaloacetate decarboxylase (Na+ extruding) subunit gamma